jgi:cell division protein FtsB
MYLKWDQRQGQPPVYVCSSYRTAKGPCGNSRLRADTTDTAIWKSAVEYFTDLSVLIGAVKQAMGSDDVKQRQEDVEAAKSTLATLERRKKAIQRMVAMDEDEDAMVMYRKIKAEIAEAKIRLVVVQAQAEPFGSQDAVEIARAILSRFAGSGEWTVPQKQQALAEVVERITIDEDARATFVVRGGMPIHSVCAGRPMHSLLDLETKANLVGIWSRNRGDDEMAPIDVIAGSLMGYSPASQGKTNAKLQKSS